MFKEIMKKIIAISLAVMCIAMINPLEIRALTDNASFDDDGKGCAWDSKKYLATLYEANEDGPRGSAGYDYNWAYIKEYNGAEAALLTIPEAFGGYKLKAIDTSAFKRCPAKKIIIPESVEIIEGSAFKECGNLEEINIPSGVKVIDPETFKGCSNLSNISLPNSVTTLQDDSFNGCTSITSITIPSSVKNIYQNVFKDCTGLKTIVIEDASNITVFYANAFTGCTSINSIEIKNVTDKSQITQILNAISTSNVEGTTIKVPKEYEAVIKAAYPDAKVIPVTPSAPSSPSESKKEDKEENKETASVGTPTGPSKSVYEEKMDSLVKELGLASAEADKAGTAKTIYLKDVTALSLSAMKALKGSSNVVLDMTYIYNGVVFHVVIPSGSTVYTDESIPWYGPVWLYTYYGQGALTNASGSTSNVYVVQSGDTLRKIAAKLSVSLDEIIKKNPQIKNVDKLSLGDKINY